MKISGLKLPLWMYGLVGLLGGAGLGIMYSNIYLLSFETGLIIAIISFILSVYIWRKYMMKYFIKNQ